MSPFALNWSRSIAQRDYIRYLVAVVADELIKEDSMAEVVLTS